jgi:hypothetical protein
MHYLPTAGRSLILILALAGSSVTFAQSSGNLVSAETKALAMDRLDEAEFALSSGELAEAHRLVEEAADAPSERHGRGLASLSARTLGPEVYPRLFDLRYRIRTAMGRKAEENGLIWEMPQRERDGPARWDSRNALQWYLDAANPDEIIRVIRNAPEQLQLFTYLGSASYDDQGKATFTMGSIGSYGYGEPLYDAEPIARELEIHARFENEVIPLYLERIRTIANNQLAREATQFDSPLTEMEQRYSEDNWQEVQQAVTGVEAEALAPIEVRRKLLRSGDSQKLLRDAESWFELLRDPAELAPLEARAAARGETFLAIGDDESIPVLTRSDAYEEASRYFYIGGNNKRADQAQDLYLALGPEVEAYQERRNAMMEEAEQRMRVEAEAVEQSIQDMQKTEQEKAEFEAEADALEDALGF